MTLELLLIISLLIYFVLIRIFKHKLQIEDKEFIYKHANKVHKIGEGFIVLIFLGVLAILIFHNKYQSLIHYVFLFLFSLNGFRAFMEWKYNRSSKKYILSSSASVFCLILFLIIHFFIINKV